MIDNSLYSANLNVGDVILSVKDLCKYFGENKVLTGINIDIKKGDVVAVVGPSGCGKSTFLRCLNLLETPNAGEIVFEGEYVYKLYSLYAKEKINEIKAEIKSLKKQKQEIPATLIEKLNALNEEYLAQKAEEKAITKTIQKSLNKHRQKIGMVFQQFNLFNNLTVMQNILLAPNVVAGQKINKLKVEIARLQKHVDNERQPKKRFELNDELKKLKKELESLEN